MHLAKAKHVSRRSSANDCSADRKVVVATPTCQKDDFTNRAVHSATGPACLAQCLRLAIARAAIKPCTYSLAVYARKSSGILATETIRSRYKCCRGNAVQTWLGRAPEFTVAVSMSHRRYRGLNLP
jgi:hypothetical protein